MTKGDIARIYYCNMKKSLTATFCEQKNGIMFFKNIHGIFGVTEMAVTNGEITIEVMED